MCVRQLSWMDTIKASFMQATANRQQDRCFSSTTKQTESKAIQQQHEKLARTIDDVCASVELDGHNQKQAVTDGRNIQMNRVTDAPPKMKRLAHERTTNRISFWPVVCRGIHRSSGPTSGRCPETTRETQVRSRCTNRTTPIRSQR